jgi:lambda family phage portal protein
MRQMIGGGRGGYEAGKRNRLTGHLTGSPHENDIPRAQIQTLRYRAWNLYRNNPQARKICRTLKAKVIGRGLSPQSQATNKDGTPFVEFRRRARQGWEEFCKECDFRGKPGSGGQNMTNQAKTGLQANILSGGFLYRVRHLSKAEQAALGLYVPLQIQLLHADRLDELKHGGNLFYGLELDNDGKVLGYWVHPGGVQQPLASNSLTPSVFVPAQEMRHLFAEEDIDQLFGAPWVGAMMLTADDRRDYELSEIEGAKAASCIVGTFSRASGQTGTPGLASDSGPLTDSDGNPITRLQPQMLLDVGRDGKFDLSNPSRPNSNAEAFLAHLVRGESVAMPGVKSSTLTGDYRQSSFSSERSADNDVWPEIEEIQDWFAQGFYQPIYEEFITAAVLNGRFDDVKGFSSADFNNRRREFLKNNWQGPVSRSINPSDDAEASRQRIRNGQSTPQIEAANIGREWRENIDAISEFIQYCEEREIPEDVIQQMLGIDESNKQATDVIDPNADPNRPTEPVKRVKKPKPKPEPAKQGMSIERMLAMIPLNNAEPREFDRTRADVLQANSSAQFDAALNILGRNNSQPNVTVNIPEIKLPEVHIDMPVIPEPTEAELAEAARLEQEAAEKVEMLADAKADRQRTEIIETVLSQVKALIPEPVAPAQPHTYRVIRDPKTKLAIGYEPIIQ